MLKNNDSSKKWNNIQFGIAGDTIEFDTYEDLEEELLGKIDEKTPFYSYDPCEGTYCNMTGNIKENPEISPITVTFD